MVTCPRSRLWCWAQPADALTGAVVRCCERSYAFVKWTSRTEKREWYWMCTAQRSGRREQEGRCGS